MKTETEKVYEETSKLLEKALSLFNQKKFVQAKPIFQKLRSAPIPEFKGKADTYLEIMEKMDIKEKKFETNRERIYEIVRSINEKEPDRALEIAKSLKVKDASIDYLKALAFTMLDRKEEAVQSLKEAISKEKRYYFLAKKEPDLFPLWDSGLLEDIQ